MKSVFIAMSHSGFNVKEIEIACVFDNEELAISYVEEMDDCCTQGRVYWFEEHYVQE